MQVHTDEGLVGPGEATVSALWTGETNQSCASTIVNLIARALIGSDPTRISNARTTMDRVVKLSPFTRSAVEMDLWGLFGKAAGLPVYQLFGDRIHDDVPMKMMIGAFEIPRAVVLAERFLALGMRWPESQDRARPGRRS